MTVFDPPKRGSKSTFFGPHFVTKFSYKWRFDFGAQKMGQNRNRSICAKKQPIFDQN
jgi:hypothetical protein